MGDNTQQGQDPQQQSQQPTPSKETQQAGGGQAAQNEDEGDIQLDEVTDEQRKRDRADPGEQR